MDGKRTVMERAIIQRDAQDNNQASNAKKQPEQVDEPIDSVDQDDDEPDAADKKPDENKLKFKTYKLE